MNDVPVEMLQEIGLYLDPKSYYRLRNSFQTQLPLQQRILPCYFDHPHVGVLLPVVIVKDVLQDVIKLTEVDSDCIRKLVHYGVWDVLVPFAQQVLEIVPDFYHQDKLEIAIINYQNVYIKALFSHSQNSVALIRNLYPNDLHRNLHNNRLTSIPPEIGQLSGLSILYHNDLT
jgi:hypothetical protein